MDLLLASVNKWKRAVRTSLRIIAWKEFMKRPENTRPAFLGLELKQSEHLSPIGPVISRFMRLLFAIQCTVQMRGAIHLQWPTFKSTNEIEAGQLA